MNRVLKYIVLSFLALATLGLYGCAKEEGVKSEKKEKRERPDKLEIVSLDKVSGNLTDGLKITLTVRNNSGYNVVISEAEAFLHYKERKIGRLMAEGDIELPRRNTTQVDVPIRITVSNFLTAYAAFKRINQKLYDGFAISYSAAIKAGALKFKVKDEMVPFEELAKDFNQGFQDKK